MFAPCLAIGAALAVVASARLFAQEETMQELPLEEAIRVMDQLDRAWTCTQWELKAINGKLASADDPETFVPDGTWTHARTILEPTSGRIRVEAEYTLRWIHGLAPFASHRGAFAFDGETTRRWETLRPGQELPEEGRSGTGEIGREDARLIGDSKWTSGSGCFPPYFCGYRLPEQLRRVHQMGKPARVRKQPDGSWQIECWDFTFDDDAIDETYQIHIGYDPTKNGVVTGATWHQPPSDRYKTPAIRKRMLVDLQRLADGAWAPRRVRLITTHERQMNEYVYGNVVRNPPVTPATFRISFPRGIRVTDQIHQKLYTVGSGLENDQRAVQAFLKEQKLAEAPPRRRGRWPWLLAALGLLTGTGAAAMFLRNRMLAHWA